MLIIAEKRSQLRHSRVKRKLREPDLIRFFILERMFVMSPYLVHPIIPVGAVKDLEPYP